MKNIKVFFFFLSLSPSLSPSPSMYSLHLRLHLSVSDILKYVCFLPNVSVKEALLFPTVLLLFSEEVVVLFSE